MSEAAPARTTCARLGVPPAAHPMRVCLMRGRNRWVVYIHVVREDAQAAMDWLECLEPRTVHMSSSGVIRAELDGIPAGLFDALHGRRFMEIRLFADATAWLGDRATGPERAAFAPHGLVESAGVSLTPRQVVALSRAVAAGYYALPRRTDLQRLADALGISTSAYSELLRRAEARLVEAYVRRLASDRAAVDGQAERGTPESGRWRSATLRP